MKRASRHRAGLRCWTKNGEPFLVRVCRRLPPWGHHWPYPNGTTLPKTLFPISNCRLPIFEDLRYRSFPLLYRNLRYPASQLAIGNWKSLMSLVDLARLERATSTFAQSRSNSVELQVPLIFQIGLCPTNFSLSCVANRPV